MTMNTQRRALLAAGLGAPVLLPMAARAQGIPKAWDRTVDILVVGTGFAGLCAAIEAKRAGANPLLIDMMPFTGGNSRITGGGIAVPGSDLQKAKGIKDSPELMLADMLKAGNNINVPALAHTVAYQAKDAYDWLVKDIGVKFTRLIYHGGHSVPRDAAQSCWMLTSPTSCRDWRPRHGTWAFPLRQERNWCASLPTITAM